MTSNTDDPTSGPDETPMDDTNAATSKPADDSKPSDGPRPTDGPSLDRASADTVSPEEPAGSGAA